MSGVNVDGGLTFDNSGNLYAASGSGVVKVTSSKIVTTYASGISNPTGLAFDSSGNLYVANYYGGVSMVTSSGVVTGFVSALFQTVGLAFDNTGTLYVSCITFNAGTYNGNIIYAVTPNGIITTYAVGLAQPRYLALDSDGNLYATNYNSGTVSKITSGGAAIATIASGFSGPEGLALDGSGNLYVASSGNNVVYVINKPLAPTITSASAGGVNTGTAVVNFTAGADQGSYITSCQVTSNPAGGSGSTTGAGVSPITVYGLNQRIAYTFSVTCTNGIGTSPASSASSSVTPVGVPLVPSIGSPTVVNTSSVSVGLFRIPIMEV